MTTCLKKRLKSNYSIILYGRNIQKRNKHNSHNNMKSKHCEQVWWQISKRPCIIFSFLSFIVLYSQFNRPKSAPTEARLSHWKRCCWNASSVWRKATKCLSWWIPSWSNEFLVDLRKVLVWAVEWHSILQTQVRQIWTCPSCELLMQCWSHPYVVSAVFLKFSFSCLSNTHSW